jgi:RNA polymerase sigma factor (sigma-70 family)
VADSIDKLAADLSTAIAAGDAIAVEKFYSQYFDFLYQHARRATLRDEAFCLDVVQDAVIRIIRTIRRVESEAQLRGWLGLVIRTTAYDLLKSERRRGAREAALVPADGNRGDIDEDQLEQLRAEINRLDPHLARMIELRFERQWTLARIAGRFGLSVGTIDGRLRRALLTLRERLTEKCHD